jgi:hypothetical protein
VRREHPRPHRRAEGRREAVSMTHRWYWRKWLGERHGQPCRVVAVGKMNSALVEFADGFRVLTVRYAVRRVTP